jgi:hypothetical protein
MKMILSINDLYRNYKSTRRVALELNIGRGSVVKYLNEENIEILVSKKIKKVSASKSVIDWRKEQR